MRNSVQHLAILIFWVLCLPPAIATANLEDSLAKAKSRASFYEAKYGAVAPLFKTNDKGIVVWECWAGPPNEWTKKEVLEFARLLIPKRLWKETPRKGKADGIYEPHTYSDGTMIILSSGLGSRYMGLEVRAPQYTGPRC